MRNKGIHLLIQPEQPAAPQEPAKRGRKKGSGNRTEQLNIRVQPELLQLISFMQTDAEIFKDFSVSDIIHHCISGDAAFLVATGAIKWEKHIKQLINAIKSH